MVEFYSVFGPMGFVTVTFIIGIIIAVICENIF